MGEGVVIGSSLWEAVVQQQEVVEEQMEERVQQKMAEEEQIEERVLKREARAQVWTASYCLEAPGVSSQSEEEDLSWTQLTLALAH